MSTTGPGKPSSRRAAAALPPATPPPMITIGVPADRAATQYILPPEATDVRALSRRPAEQRPGGRDEPVQDQGGLPAPDGPASAVSCCTGKAAAISSTARRRLPPMDGGASNSTTPSRVARNADW